jgi:hypothetical protein
VISVKAVANRASSAIDLKALRTTVFATPRRPVTIMLFSGLPPTQPLEEHARGLQLGIAPGQGR